MGDGLKEHLLRVVMRSSRCERRLWDDLILMCGMRSSTTSASTRELLLMMPMAFKVMVTEIRSGGIS